MLLELLWISVRLFDTWLWRYKMKTVEFKKMLASGNLWERGEVKRRYYSVDEFCDFSGLDVSWYKTGNISAASLNGDSISNGIALELVAFDKFYYCYSKKQFVIATHFSSHTFKEFLGGWAEKINLILV